MGDIWPQTAASVTKKLLGWVDGHYWCKVGGHHWCKADGISRWYSILYCSLLMDFYENFYLWYSWDIPWFTILNPLSPIPDKNSFVLVLKCGSYLMIIQKMVNISATSNLVISIKSLTNREVKTNFFFKLAIINDSLKLTERN